MGADALQRLGLYLADALAGDAELLAHLHERQEKRGNCTMKDRAELWLRFGGENLDISPPNFHHALAAWLARRQASGRQAQGVRVTKSTNDFLMVVTLTSDDRQSVGA